MSSPTQSAIASGVVIVIGVAIFLALMLLQAIADRNDPRRCSRALSYMDPGCQGQVSARE